MSFGLICKSNIQNVPAPNWTKVEKSDKIKQ